jgi:hypothetical protein
VPEEKQLQASVKSVLQLVAANGLGGDAEIRCSILGQSVDAKATLKLGHHSHGSSYSTWIKHLEIEFDDEYIDRLVANRVATIFAKLAKEACAKEEPAS